MPKLTDYLLTAQAAEVLGVSQNTLRTWADEGKIPTRRNPANGYRLFQRKDLEAFLRQVERSARSSSAPGRRKPR
jgi:excisionase family DNA binding protein